MFLLRALAVWLLIMTAESVHGALRQLLLAPMVGDFRARQISFFTGMLLIFGITYWLISWIKAEKTISLIAIGLSWAVLTALFEFGIGLYVLDYSWARMLEDYDLSHGGLMGFGLVFISLAPLLAGKMRFGRILNSRQNAASLL